MADDRETMSTDPDLPPPPSDEEVARIARALGAPMFNWRETANGGAAKSDEPARAEVE